MGGSESESTHQTQWILLLVRYHDMLLDETTFVYHCPNLRWQVHELGHSGSLSSFRVCGVFHTVVVESF